MKFMQVYYIIIFLIMNISVFSQELRLDSIVNVRSIDGIESIGGIELFSYHDDRNLRICEKFRRSKTGVKEIVSKKNVTYNDLGQTLDSVFHRYYPSESVDSIIYEYDQNRRVKKILKFKNREGSGKMYLAQFRLFEYQNKSERIDFVTTIIPANTRSSRHDTLRYKRYYEYTEDGKLSLTKDMNKRGNPTPRTSYVYNSNDQLEMIINERYNYKKGIYEKLWTKVYSYSNDGLRVTITRLRYKLNTEQEEVDGQIVVQHIYRMDGFIDRKQFFDLGEIQRYQRYYYSY